MRFVLAQLQTYPVIHRLQVSPSVRIWQTLEVYGHVCVPVPTQKFQSLWEAAWGKHLGKGSKLAQEQKSLCLRGMDSSESRDIKNPSSQTITCVCLCHLVIASCCKVPMENSEVAAPPLNVPSALGPGLTALTPRAAHLLASALWQLQSHSCSHCPNSFPETSPILVYK